MTDVDLIEKRLAWIETLLKELRSLIRPDEILTDLKALRFAEYTLQVAIQAALDISSHIVSDERLCEPRSNKDLFRILARWDWLPKKLSESLERMAGFRNILVHGYLEVDPRIVKGILENDLGDLDGFVDATRGRLARGN